MSSGVGDPKFTPEVQEQIIQAVGVGAYRQDAAEFAGVTPRTLQRWMKDAKDNPEGSRYADFARKVLRAERASKVLALGVVQKAAKDGDWRAAAWMLERKFPQEYAERSPLFLLHHSLDQIGTAAEEAGINLPQGVWQQAWTNLARDLASRLPAAMGLDGGGLANTEVADEIDDVEVTEAEKDALVKLLRHSRGTAAREEAAREEDAET